MKTHRFGVLTLATSSFLLASIAACTANNPASEEPVGATDAEPSICQTEQLVLKEVTDDAGAGNQALILSLINESNTPCQVEGYPTVQFLASNQEPLNLDTDETTQTYFLSTSPAQAIMLQPTDEAHFEVAFEVMPVGDQQSCPTAAQLEVIPPNQTEAMTLPVNTQVCGTQIKVTPVQIQTILP
jgi:hypothetical protein